MPSTMPACCRVDSSFAASSTAASHLAAGRWAAPPARRRPAAPPATWRRHALHPLPPSATFSSEAPSPPQPREAIPTEIVRANSPELLSACAALRIGSFYQYPGPKGGAFLFGAEAQGRDCQSWLDNRMRLEEGRLTNMQALGMRVVSLAAIAPSSLVPPHAPVSGAPLTAAHGGLSPEHCQVPFWWRRVRDARMGSVDDVVGTLDVHVGAKLPSEILEGSLPLVRSIPSPQQVGEDLRPAGSIDQPGMMVSPPGETGEGDFFLSARGSYRKAISAGVVTVLDERAGLEKELAGRRAYIFNVCVLAALRRRGIASKLIRAAHAVAADMGVEVMYIHVEADNPGAQGMYESLGYVLEKEEEEWLAERMGRPRRLLLRKHIA